MMFNVLTGSNNHNSMSTPQIGVAPVEGNPNVLMKAPRIPDNFEAWGSGMSKNIELQSLILTLQQ